MRLALLGPALDHERELETAARLVRDALRAERAVYLGADRAIEAVVSRWAEELVGAQAGDDSLLKRATAECLSADPAQIDAFIDREHERGELRMFESLAGGRTRSVELIAGKVAVMLYDKAHLEEEDILPASLLVFGKSRDPLVKRVGRRWFLSPGMFPDHGVMLIDDEEDELRATIFDRDLQAVDTHVLKMPKGLKMQVSGDS